MLLTINLVMTKFTINNSNSILENKLAITDFVQNNTVKILKTLKNETLKIQETRNYETDDVFWKLNNQSYFFENKNIPFPSPKKATFKFIDLFAGIGGFRIAMQNLGGECIFTSEWDERAKKTYFANFGEIPFGDITNIEIKSSIPENFDVLCAGFPCQPFSKGGFRNGFEDTRGTLFFDLCEIIKKHNPKFLLLENVSNLVTHDKGNTYKVILKSLNELGYHFPDKPIIISPDKFGVPILRPRVYIPCVRKDLVKENSSKIIRFYDEIQKLYTTEIDSIDTILDTANEEKLTHYEEKILTVWDEFYQGIDLDIIGFPIWMDYFKFDGSLDEFPIWKAKFIQKNIHLYDRNKKFIDKWLKKHSNLDWCTNTHRKMEWQAGNQYKSLFDCLIQFRPSGIRVKKPDKFSTLVAMNHQQIIGKYRRKISVEESKLLQSFPKDFLLSSNATISMKQLGNSVNVKVVETIFKVILNNFYPVKK